MLKYYFLFTEYQSLDPHTMFTHWDHVLQCSEGVRDTGLEVCFLIWTMVQVVKLVLEG